MGEGTRLLLLNYVIVKAMLHPGLFIIKEVLEKVFDTIE